VTDEPPGRGLASRRAVAEVVRRAALRSYGVIEVRERRWWQDLPARAGLGVRGVRVRSRPALSVELHLRIALGVPIAEVARNVEEAVRYTVRTSLEREIDALEIHVDGVRAGGGRGPRRTAAVGDGSSEGRPSRVPSRSDPGAADGGAPRG
jgi:uncharacterized alkaline shock family protein YloU